MKRLSLTALSTMSLLTLLTTTGDAQESSEKFYQRNYAETPLRGEGTTRAGESDDLENYGIGGKRRRSDESRPPLVPLQNEEQEPDEGSSSSAGDDSVPASIVPENRPGVPVLSIGAVINSLEFGHFNRELNSLSLLAEKFDFEIGRVYAIGDFQMMLASGKTLGRLMARRGEFDWLPTVPESFKITRSPTWIISTQEGDILIEGLPLLPSFFNEKGEFVESAIEDMKIEADVIHADSAESKVVTEAGKET